MSRRIILFLCCAAICFLTTACAKLEDVRPLSVNKGGDLPTLRATFLDAVPSDYGDLIAVTSNADYPSWSQAWFMRSDKSIVIVSVNAESGRILKRIVTIPRR